MRLCHGHNDALREVRVMYQEQRARGVQGHWKPNEPKGRRNPDIAGRDGALEVQDEVRRVPLSGPALGVLERGRENAGAKGASLAPRPGGAQTSSELPRSGKSERDAERRRPNEPKARRNPGHLGLEGVCGIDRSSLGRQRGRTQSLFLIGV